MSRVILSRHPDGTEKVVVGYDRPLQTYFADRYGPADEYGEGECEVTVGPMVGMVIETPDDLDREAARGGIEITWTSELVGLLADMATLDYPESNRVIDLSETDDVDPVPD